MTRIKKATILGLVFIAAAFITMWILVAHPKFLFAKKEAANSIYFPDSNLEVNLEYATTPYEWTKGLMFRTSMPENSGMLFIFPDEQIRTFWMKDTLIPLDIIFISKDKKIVDIKENFQPCTSGVSCGTYESKFPAMYVLEANAGIVAKYNLKTGDSAEF